MFTQCPHCQTLFRIRSEQLKIAAGRVRCSQCHQTFNALDSLQESPSGRTESTQAPPANHERETDWVPLSAADSLAQDPLGLEWEQQYDAINVKEGLVDSDLDLFQEQDDGLESAPEYLTSSTESQMSSLMDSDSSPVLALEEAPLDDSGSTTGADTQREPISQATPPNVPAPGPREMRESEGEPLFKRRHHQESSIHTPTNLSSFTTKLKAADSDPDPTSLAAAEYTIDQMFEKEPFDYVTIAWGLGSLLLAVVLILQLAWHYRDQVIQKEPGRQLLTQLCSVLDCTVPQRRDTTKILVEYRDLRVHPELADVLQLQLQMVNRAGFAQPYPKLHLSLFNDEEKLIADRIFLPAEYLPKMAAGQTLMHSTQALRVNLELMDPGKEVTGFKFEFL
ncbi:MAG: DUF3426 domain-containing protein [Chromatiales bacterium]|jgi:predicted Zn finger-like uncharacterized protein